MDAGFLSRGGRARASFFCEFVYPAAIEARRVAQINSFASHGRLLNSQWAAALPAPLVLRFVCSARQSRTLSSYLRLFGASALQRRFCLYTTVGFEINANVSCGGRRSRYTEGTLSIGLARIYTRTQIHARGMHGCLFPSKHVRISTSSRKQVVPPLGSINRLELAVNTRPCLCFSTDDDPSSAWDVKPRA